MNEVLQSLQLVDINAICFHETHEKARFDKIADAIQAEGVLRNPPLVLAMADGRYLLLDGAHRVHALQQLGCRRAVVHLVQESDMKLGAWSHILPAGPWLFALLADERLIWEDMLLCDPDARPLTTLLDASGRERFCYPKSHAKSLSDRLDAWHLVVNAYSHDIPVRRVAEGTPVVLEPSEVLLSYPTWSIAELKQVVSEGLVMPAGVTRCVVNGRLLNLRIPLHLLTDESFPQHAWEDLCGQWQKGLRLYTEPVYVCEI